MIQPLALNLASPMMNNDSSSAMSKRRMQPHLALNPMEKELNMKRILAVLVLAAMTAPAFAGVGVSVNIGEPGFFGRIDLGDAPPPQVVYAQPRIVQRTTVVQDPVYLRVPSSQQRSWSRYCGRYNACGQPVYFVKDDWYSNVYAPHYRERHGDHRDHDDHRGHDDDHGPGRDDHGRGHDDHDHGDGRDRH